MPWMKLPSGTPYFMTRLPEGAEVVPAPDVTVDVTAEPAQPGNFHNEPQEEKDA